MDESVPSTSRGSGDVTVKVEEEPIETLTVTYFALVPPIPAAERLAAEVKVEPEDGAATTDQPPIEVKKEIKVEPGTSVDWKHAKKNKGRKKNNKPAKKAKAGSSRNGRRYQCHLCQRRCRSQIGLEEHIRTHVDERPFRCNICGKSFKRKGNLVRHFKTHSNERPFGCSHCEMKFKHNHNHRKHMKTHTELPFSCTICRQNFAKPNALGKHEMAGKCHGFECHLCGKHSFRHKHHLKEHMRTHTGDKPYQCERCRKCFAVYSNLKQHLATHSDEKPFSCNFCSKKFKWKENLKRHSNMHPDQFPFECSNIHCDRRFANKDQKTAHEKRCKKVRHNCAICGKSFTSKSGLQGHLAVHSTEKNFKCEICGKTYKMKTSLYKHSKWH